MNGLELLILGLALALALFAAYALRRGRERRIEQRIEHFTAIALERRRQIEQQQQSAPLPDPEFQALDRIEWWPELWSDQPEGV